MCWALNHLTVIYNCTGLVIVRQSLCMVLSQSYKLDLPKDCFDILHLFHVFGWKPPWVSRQSRSLTDQPKKQGRSHRHLSTSFHLTMVVAGTLDHHRPPGFTCNIN